MLSLVLIAIAFIPTRTITRNVTEYRTDHDVQNKDFARSGIFSFTNIDERKETPRSCTLNDEHCIPICCEPVRHDNPTSCYANATLSTIKDINFSETRNCNLTIFSMSADELIQERNKRYALGQETEYDIIFYVLENGTISENNTMNNYQGHWLDLNNYYCLTSLVAEDGTIELDAVCFPPAEDIPSTDVTLLYLTSTAVALPFLIVTYIVYWILPKFQNMHGYTLRAYIASLIVMFTSLIVSHFDKTDLCTSLVFITYFSSIACFSWVNVMSFDIWWTFRKYRAVPGNHKQLERRKFILYSIFAWGSATILTGVCAAIDFVPSVPQTFIKPELGIKACWVFGTFAARAIYYYAPSTVSVIINLYLFASTIIKINQQTKDLALHFEGPDSHRHNYNKERFDFSVKLTTMMVINSSMEIVNCLCERNSLRYFWAILDLANTVQALTIFIIFVWTDSVKLQLCKRLGFQDGIFKNWSPSTKSSTDSQSGPKTMSTSY